MGTPGCDDHDDVLVDLMRQLRAAIQVTRGVRSYHQVAPALRPLSRPLRSAIRRRGRIVGMLRKLERAG